MGEGEDESNTIHAARYTMVVLDDEKQNFCANMRKCSEKRRLSNADSRL